MCAGCRKFNYRCGAVVAVAVAVANTKRFLTLSCGSFTKGHANLPYYVVVNVALLHTYTYRMAEPAQTPLLLLVAASATAAAATATTAAATATTTA